MHKCNVFSMQLFRNPYFYSKVNSCPNNRHPFLVEKGDAVFSSGQSTLHPPTAAFLREAIKVSFLLYCSWSGWISPRGLSDFRLLSPMSAC